jgi:hypothetical protein
MLSLDSVVLLKCSVIGFEVLTELLESPASCGVNEEVTHLDPHSTEQRGVVGDLQLHRVA